MIFDTVVVTAICGLVGKVVSDVVTSRNTSRKDKLEAALARQKEQDEQALRLRAQQIELDKQLAAISASYIQLHAGDVELMRGLLERGEFEQLAAMAHKIKGTGGMYGYPEISRVGKSIEQSSKEQNANDTLVAQLQDLTGVLATYLARQPPPPVAPIAVVAAVPPAT